MSKQLEVSKSGYYKWLHRKETKEEVENKQLAIWIKEYDDKYNHILGYRRMTNWINRDKGTSFSKGRVQRIKLFIRSRNFKFGNVSCPFFIWFCC